MIKTLFILGCWKQHDASKTHQQAVVWEQEKERIEAKRLAGNEAVTKIEQIFLAQKSKTKHLLRHFYNEEDRKSTAHISYQE